MIRLIRTTGFLLIVAGALVILTWLIEPLREALRNLWPWYRALPLPVQVGSGLAVIGLLILMISLLWERFEDRENDRSLLDEP
ncbi:MAG: hypothetical protein GY711_00845 [bacterium]|nr:hypothetical protein [bacterium]